MIQAHRRLAFYQECLALLPCRFEEKKNSVMWQKWGVF